ncbi:MAG: SAM-dependent methyltransferase [Rhizobiaceae bacterium]
MFNELQHQQRIARAKARFIPDADFLMTVVVEDMMERLSAVNRTFENGIALFGRTPLLADAMGDCSQIRNVLRVDEVQHLGTADHIATPTLLGLKKESADLIIAPLSLHWSNDLPGTLIQLRQTLRPDGLLLAVLPGPDTLHELRTALLSAESECTDGAAMRVDAFTDIRDAGALLQRTQYALPVVDQDLTIVRYDRAMDLIRDLRGFGVTSHPAEDTYPPLTRTILRRMEEIYVDRFSDADGRIRASFSFISMAGWGPHESQQKPLKPGSATTRLADALKVKEVKL